jgi:hypothetical protein
VPTSALRDAAFQPAPTPSFASKRETRSRHLLEKPLEQRRHVAEPKRKEQHEVLGPSDVGLGLTQRSRQIAFFPLL